MKTIIAGSRDLGSMDLIASAALAAMFREDIYISEVVSGGCRGVDVAGEQWAASQGISINRFPADWKTHGRAAGPMRNRQMAEYADALIAIWDGKSKGTKNMIEEAHKAGLVVYVHKVE